MRKGICIYIVLSTSFAALMQLQACKEKYTPVTQDINPNYFVVEGLINMGADSTIFTLSRTFKLDNKAVVAPEKAAIVQVESEAGNTYVLPELVKSGNYGRPSLGLDPTKKYRLRIRTKDNKEYLSDFVESKTSPPVKLTHDFKNNNLNIYSTTRDASGRSRYYLYSYVETWQYTAQIWSYWKVVNHQMVRRDFPADDVYNCWQIVPSGNIVLASTSNLTDDNLADNFIADYPSSSSKLGIKFSIHVKQTVLTKEGFDFWQALRKNTQQIGSIFDAQPSLLSGNIKSTANLNEVVIGFVSAGTTTNDRHTLSYTDMPSTWVKPAIDLTGCLESVKDLIIARGDVNTFITGPAKPLYFPIYEIPDGKGGIAGYTASTREECVECRVQGGVNVKPSYW
ncbi:DUF4249 domain-containing protein [Mucilaginibacter calamicampi]|uniref:DUF4249 domain-containing protein n=1 Tax=Mucilaginibacter calamicampi TaxID=1302352 RepID=A0ABW2YWY9_9SPHI